MNLVPDEVTMDPLTTTALALTAFAVGAVIAFLLAQRLSRSRIQSATDAANAAIAAEKARLATEHLKQVAAADAEVKAKAAEALARQREALEASLSRDRSVAAEERAAAQRSRAEAEAAEERARTREAKLAEREASLDRRRETVDAHEARLREQDQASATRLRELGERAQRLEQGEQAIDARLAEIAGLTLDAAKEELFKRLDAGLAAEQSERIAKKEKDLSLRAKELGVEIISRAIQRYAAEHTAETTSAKIKLADEEMKGRIIGKEGRNIKAFEQATGVDLLLDDQQPNVITISCFSGLRREMARRTLTVLLEDGRIHPGRIEEVMAKVQQDMDREVLKLGEDAAFAVEVSGLHPQLLRLLGKLQWRTSYGQNVLQHTQEVAFLCGAMAADLGLDPKLGRRCGLMHDIGKAIDHEQEGSHPELGYEALKRFGENEIVANAALAHHEGHAVLSAYTVLAAAADAISAARPGARSKNIEGYIKRLEKLEEIATGYHGVQKAYAIQAGRELRVIVSGRDVPDAELPKLAREIAKRIEDEVTFPGEVKVTIIREMRHFAVAR